ncbi:apolipoprotein N-acyltransferase [Sulfitobacter albidus]|uniref:Apolipoprotein N-acyltransferase n=1 Tax=Sulfitobacter albidus TaxID=2829501 RepID=A0A975PL85_9RHOB|nr:apolipoprotein N-acyltransferase [Sulfitobacter albidus]QUJ75409.1 apolipoprotein N-acyltransferase [Sulfitobacter albidus]
MTSARAAWARALGVAAGLGAVTALGQAPFGLPIAMMIGLAGAIWYFAAARSPKAALLYGWAFGFGYFALTLHWIVSPFLVDVARHGWMAPFAVVLMALGGGAFWALAFWTARRLSPQAWPLILTLPTVELIRAYIFTGFPWGTLAQATVDSLAGQSLALWGPYALTLWLVAVAVAVARSGAHPLPRVLLAIGAAALLWIPPQVPPAPMTDQTWRIVQPNAPQHLKWDPAMIPMFFDRQLEFTAAPTTGPQPDAILWPETAIPWRLDRAGAALSEIAVAANGTPVILGVQRADGERYFNALIALDGDGQITQTYDKHHLVPFGEYIPLGDFMARFGVTAMAPQHGAGFSAGPGPRTLDLGPLGRALPLICYEAVFAHDLNAPTRADYILHATNDAWFGTFAGPQQHLAQARMRAIEQGLPVIRAANTGISAMIDPWGRLRDSLKLNVAGYLDAGLPAPRAPTPYARTGDLPLAVLLLAGLIGAAAQRRRTLRRPK